MSADRGRGGDPQGVVDDAGRVREAGWRQIAGWTPDASRSRGWPPADDDVTVELTLSQWRLVVDCLTRWSQVEGAAGDEAQAAGTRAVAALSSDQVT